MLTSDLVLARTYRGEVRPRYVDRTDEDLLALADTLVATFEAHLGNPLAELDAELGELLGTGTAFLLHRGLAKLLRDRCVFETTAPQPPAELRRVLFEHSAAAYRSAPLGEPSKFDRQLVVEQAAAELGLPGEVLEDHLYADLKDQQRLVSFERCDPLWLLDRYNVALAQAVLLRAVHLRLVLTGDDPRRHRALFQKIKFFQLMHRLERGEKGSWTIVLDGPLSLFQSSQRYGLQMASFLPALLHLQDWQLEAEVRWGKKRLERSFKLSPKSDLRSHTKLTGQWQPDEVRWFPGRFAELSTDWQISTEGDLVDLGGEGVLVPDFVFDHPSGIRVVMEVLGYWRRGAVENRLKLLRRHGPKNLLLAISKQLAGGEEGLDELAGEVYVYRSSPLARQVLKQLAQFLD